MLGVGNINIGNYFYKVFGKCLLCHCIRLMPKLCKAIACDSIPSKILWGALSLNSGVKAGLDMDHNELVGA